MTRDQIRQAADIIRETISAKDYAALIGLPVNRAGFARCPFHAGDHTGSLKLYDGRRGWTCFGCHASGDVIELAKRYYNLSFPQAIMKISQDAGIAIPGNGSMTYEQARALQIASENKTALRKRQSEQERIEDTYWNVFDDWLAIDRAFSDLDDQITEIINDGNQPDDNLMAEFFSTFSARRAITPVLDDIETRRVRS